MPGPGHVDLKAFVGGFVLEADENLHSVNRNLVAITEAVKRGKPEPRAIRELFRSYHTIKGLASMVGAEPIVELTHEMESMLRTAERAGGRLPSASLDLLLQGTRAIEERVHAIRKEGIQGIPPVPKPFLEALILAQDAQAGSAEPTPATLDLPEDILKNLSPSDREQMIQAASSGRHAVLIEFRPSPQKAAQGLNITAVRERLGKLGELVKVVPRTAPGAPTGIAFALLLVTGAPNSELAEAIGGPEETVRDIRVAEDGGDVNRPGSGSPPKPSPEPAQEEWTPRGHSSIRVDIRRLDEALERLSALVVTRSKFVRVASELSRSGAEVRDLQAVIAEYSRELRRLRAAITEARMVPVEELLQRIPLIVRGLTKDSAKAVNVDIQAGTAEVDKAVADRLLPVIVHLVRNAVDHAIESREERKRANKPESGTVSVTCDDSSGTNLMLRIEDDGRGIDREAVARKAGQPVARSDEELLEQIAVPGLTTREGVTHASGRGLGMDIVKRTVEMLGGVLTLSTEEGKGSAFKLRVPVSVTIVEVLSFVVGGQTFVAPVAMVDEIIEVDPSRLVKIPVPGQEGPEPHFVERRGEAIPLLALGTLLQSRQEAAVPPKALVVNQSRGAIAFGVDRMLGQQEVVVRPLEDALVRAKGLSGATDLGDGRPTIVLDLAELGMSLMQRAA